MRQFIKYLYSDLFCPTLLGIGAGRLLQAGSKRKLILMYHGVASRSPFLLNGRHVPTAEFEAQLRYLKAYFQVVPLSELPHTETRHKAAISLSFDDGYLNNYTQAWPLLQKHKLPATFFIPSICIDSEQAVLPDDLLDLVRVGSPGKTVLIGDSLFEKQGQHKLIRRSDGLDAHRYIRSLSAETRDKLLEELSMRYELPKILADTDQENWQLMNAGHLEDMAASPLVEIGSHTHTHYDLAHVSTDTAREELVQSKRLIEKTIGQTIRSLAFPYGSYQKEHLQAARDAGYTQLIAAGPVAAGERAEVLPRMGIASGAGTARNMLQMHRGFSKFGC